MKEHKVEKFIYMNHNCIHNVPEVGCNWNVSLFSIYYKSDGNIVSEADVLLSFG